MKEQNKNTMVMIAANQLVPSHEPLRTDGAKVVADGLQESIKALGVLVPLLVTDTGTSANGEPIYEILDGNRRHAYASSKHPDTFLPCRILDKADIIGLVPNVIGTKFNPLDIAKALTGLLKDNIMTRVQAGNALGLSPAQVTQYVQLLELPEDDQTALRDGKTSFTASRKKHKAKTKNKGRKASKAFTFPNPIYPALNITFKAGKVGKIIVIGSTHNFLRTIANIFKVNTADTKQMLTKLLGPETVA